MAEAEAEALADTLELAEDLVEDRLTQVTDMEQELVVKATQAVLREFHGLAQAVAELAVRVTTETTVEEHLAVVVTADKVCSTQLEEVLSGTPVAVEAVETALNVLVMALLVAVVELVKLIILATPPTQANQPLVI